MPNPSPPVNRPGYTTTSEDRRRQERVNGVQGFGVSPVVTFQQTALHDEAIPAPTTPRPVISAPGIDPPREVPHRTSFAVEILDSPSEAGLFVDSPTSMFRPDMSASPRAQDDNFQMNAAMSGASRNISPLLGQGSLGDHPPPGPENNSTQASTTSRTSPTQEPLPSTLTAREQSWEEVGNWNRETRRATEPRTIAPHPAKRQKTIPPTMPFLSTKVDLIQQYVNSNKEGLKHESERPRFALLSNACKEEDRFYVVLHQIFCLQSLNPGALAGYLSHYSIVEFNPDIFNSGCVVISQLIKSNTLIGVRHLSWFSEFPEPLPALFQTEPHRRILREVIIFVNNLATKWQMLITACGRRNYPLLVHELVYDLGLSSTVFQDVISTAARRNMGVIDQIGGVDMDNVFKEDKAGHRALTARLETENPPTAEEVTAHNERIIKMYKQVQQKIAHHKAQLNLQQQSRRLSTQNFAPSNAASNGSPALRRISRPPSVTGQHTATPSPTLIQNLSMNPTIINSPVMVPSSSGLNSPVLNSPLTPGHNWQPPDQRNPNFQQNQVLYPPNNQGGQIQSLYNSPYALGQPAGPMSQLQAQQLAAYNHNQQLSAAQQRQLMIQNHHMIQQQQHIQTMQPHIIPSQQQYAPGSWYPQQQPIPQFMGGQSQQQQVQFQQQRPTFQQPATGAQSMGPNRGNSISRQMQAPHRTNSSSGNFPPVLLPRANVLRGDSPRGLNALSAEGIALEQQKYSRTPAMDRSVIPPHGYVHPQQSINPELTAAHQAHMRSPRLVPAVPVPANTSVEDPTRRFYQVIKEFALPPKRIPLITTLTSFDFTISEYAFEKVARDEPTTDRLSSRGFKQGTLQFRLRCIPTRKEYISCELSQWVISDTAWPSTVFLKFNEEHLDIRRKSLHGKDLPIDITPLVVAGNGLQNKVTLSLPRSQKAAPLEFYFIAVEVIEILQHQQIVDMCLQQRIPKQTTVDSIVKSLAGPSGDDSDDDFAVIPTDLAIDLADPFTARIFEIPVRGVNCIHRECFDLQTFLVTRQSKAKRPDQPCMIDVWKCPLCNRDARPYSLRVDDFLVSVRAELAGETDFKGLDVKQIMVRPDGTWYPKVEEKSQKRKAPNGLDEDNSSSDEDLVVPKKIEASVPQGQPPANASFYGGGTNNRARARNQAPIEVIELD